MSDSASDPIYTETIILGYWGSTLSVNENLGPVCLHRRMTRDRHRLNSGRDTSRIAGLEDPVFFFLGPIYTEARPGNNL